MALASVTQLVGMSSCNLKIPSLIPGWGICLGCRLDSPLGRVQQAADQCFSLTSMFFSSLSPFPSLSNENKINLKKKTPTRPKISPVFSDDIARAGPSPVDH